MTNQAIDRGDAPKAARGGDGTGVAGSMPTPRVGGEEAVLRTLPRPAPQPEASAGAPEGGTPNTPDAHPGGQKDEPAPATRTEETRKQEQQSHKAPAPSGGA